MNYIEIARQKFPKAEIHRCGRFAVVSCDALSVFLTTSEDDAKLSAHYGPCHLGRACKHEHVIINLMPTPVPDNCRDIGWGA